MRYFKNAEFDQKGLPGSGAKMDVAYLVHIDEWRHRCGFPITVNSGYRSPEYNNQVSSTGLNGPHTTGKAADYGMSGERLYIGVREAMAMKVFTGIGIAKNFIHLDTLTEADGFPRPRIWVYT